MVRGKVLDLWNVIWWCVCVCIWFETYFLKHEKDIWLLIKQMDVDEFNMPCPQKNCCEMFVNSFQ
jgi:hypothetical protein